MGYYAVKLLMEGGSQRVIGIKKNKIFDMDITEALALPKTFDTDLYNVSKILSY